MPSRILSSHTIYYDSFHSIKTNLSRWEIYQLTLDEYQYLSQNKMFNWFCQHWLLIIMIISLFVLLLAINFGTIQRFLLPLITQKFTEGLFKIETITLEKFVVLTIDDGLSYRSQEMLKLLDKYNAKATFFIHKKNTQEVSNYQEIIAKMINRGHELGNHTTQDIPSRSLSAEQFKTEFENADKFLKEFKIQPRFFRAAGGLYQTSMMMPLLVENDYEPRFIMGSFLPWDTFLPFPKIYATQLIDNIFSGAIVVFHDGTQRGNARLKRTFISLEKFLQAMGEKEYKVISLGQALNLNK